jgi:Zn-dependent protease
MNNAVQRTIPFRGIHLFTLFGFEVKLDLSWLLLALLISWSLGAGWFPARYPELSGHAHAWMGVSVAIGVFFSIVFHEFSHSIVARFYGMPIRGITLFIFGGVAEMESEPPNPKAEFLMAIAGPICSFLLAAVLWGTAAIAQGSSRRTVDAGGHQLHGRCIQPRTRLPAGWRPGAESSALALAARSSRGHVYLQPDRPGVRYGTDDSRRRRVCRR